MRVLFASLLLSSAAFPASANIQAGTNGTIVVTAPTGDEARKQARSYVRQLGIANGEQPAARWLTQICPRVVGIGRDQGAFIEHRIRELTRTVGAPLAKGACETNLLIVVTNDADRVIRTLSNRPPGRLGPPGSTSVRKLKTEPAPVRWWYNIGVQSNHGVKAGSDAPSGAKFTDDSGNPTGPPGNAFTTVLHHYSASALSSGSARGIYAATLVVDATRLNSASLKSLADFAGLVGLAEIHLGASPDNSILSLFGNRRDEALTDRDIAFLTGLYRIPLDREALLHRNMLVNEIVRPKQRPAAN